MNRVLPLILIFLTVTQATWIRDSEASDSEESYERKLSANQSPFRVVTGIIRDDSSEESGRSPIQHHVDFDTLFPGYDQIALSSEQDANILSPTPQPAQDDLVVPDFARMFPQLPRIGGQPKSSEEIGHPWWQHWAQLITTQSREWWKGSNVCIKREESEESSVAGMSGGEATLVSTTSADDGHHQFQMQFSACEHLAIRYSCQTRLFGPQVTKTIRTDYECCSGYSLDSSKTKCERGHFENLTTTIVAVGGRLFLDLAQNVDGLETKLDTENLTIFLPKVEALLSSKVLKPRRVPRNILRHPKNSVGGRNVRRNNANPPQSQSEMYPIPFDELGGSGSQEGDNEGFPNFYVVKKLEHQDEDNSMASVLLNHLVSGVLSTDDFVDERVIYSEKSGGGGILRLNKWEVGAEKVETINCARILSPNLRATNGMVHRIDRIIAPVTQSNYEVLNSRPELSMWSSLLSLFNETTTLLQDPSQHLTLLAPTNGALERLGPALLHKLRTGDSCLKRIISRHILPYTFCSSIVTGERGVVRTLEHEALDLERTADDRIFINGSEIVVYDLVTRNSVVQILDAVLLSENDKPVTEVIEREGGLSSFVQALRRVGLQSELDSLSNVTIFAPTDSAFAALSPDIRNNDEKLRQVLRYHVAKQEVRSCHFSHQQLLPTILANASIRINLYSSFPLGLDVTTTASCGVLGQRQLVGCGGVVHTVDRVLIPPTLDLVSTLKAQSSNFSIFNRLLSENQELFRNLKGRTSFYTLFVPTDAAFHALPQTRLSSILNDKVEAGRVLKRHITSDSLCCGGVAPHLHFITKRVASLGDVNVPVYRNAGGQVIYGHGTVTSCDLMATNGIIHTVSKVLAGDKDFNVGAYLLRF